MYSAQAYHPEVQHGDDDRADKALQLSEIEMYPAPGDAVLRNVILRISITHFKGNRTRDGSPIQHKITPFECHENAILDSIVLAIAVLLRRGLLSGTVAEILEKADAHPNRQIEIGTPANPYEPLLLHLTKTASYSDHDLKAASSRHIQHAITKSELEAASQVVTLDDMQQEEVLHKTQII